MHVFKNGSATAYVYPFGGEMVILRSEWTTVAQAERAAKSLLSVCREVRNFKKRSKRNVAKSRHSAS